MHPVSCANGASSELMQGFQASPSSLCSGNVRSLKAQIGLVLEQPWSFVAPPLLLTKGAGGSRQSRVSHHQSQYQLSRRLHIPPYWDRYHRLLCNPGLRPSQHRTFHSRNLQVHSSQDRDGSCRCSRACHLRPSRCQGLDNRNLQVWSCRGPGRRFFDSPGLHLRPNQHRAFRIRRLPVRFCWDRDRIFLNNLGRNRRSNQQWVFRNRKLQAGSCQDHQGKDHHKV